MRSSVVPSWLRSPKLRRALALSSVVLATGGLVLHKAHPAGDAARAALSVNGTSTVRFQGPGARGTFAISHTLVHAGETTPLFAEVRLIADRPSGERERAPASLAIVLDTSGSMRGAKLEDAKRSVLRLVDAMRDDDEIALVRYADDSALVQPLARVGDVRAALTSRVRALTAGGGTNIPSGLSRGLQALDEARASRARRVVLVSDGLDGTRARAEDLARAGSRRNITVSSLGVGLDFDHRYMASVAEIGQGNFAFIEEGGSLGGFLDRELRETSQTTIEDARVTLDLPDGLRFVGATGAEVSARGGSVELRLGALFAGDERRVIVELAAEGVGAGSPRRLGAKRSGRASARGARSSRSRRSRFAARATRARSIARPTRRCSRARPACSRPGVSSRRRTPTRAATSPPRWRCSKRTKPPSARR